MNWLEIIATVIAVVLLLWGILAIALELSRVGTALVGTLDSIAKALWRIHDELLTFKNRN